jgi:hypothetical protein
VVRIRTCDGDQFFRTEEVLQRTFVLPHHGWLTPAAPGCTHACRRGCAVVLCNGVSIPTGGLRPPRSCVAVRTYADEKTIFAMHIRTSGQERRASARRGLLTPVQSRTFSTVGLRRPLLVHGVRPLNKAPSAVHKRTCTRAAGVSPPWYGNAIATVFVHRPPTRRLRATIAVLLLQARFRYHGWLTPAAPGWKRGCGCKCAFHIRDYAIRRTAGLRQPLLVGRTHVHAQLRLPSQSGRAVRGRLTATDLGRSVGSRSRFAYLRAVRGRLTASDPGRTGFPDSIGSAGSRQAILVGSVLTWAGLRVLTPARRLWRG